MRMTKAHKQRTAREVRRRHGIELTPDEVEASLSESIRTSRRRMVEMGDTEFSTMTDEEVYRWMREAIG